MAKCPSCNGDIVLQPVIEDESTKKYTNFYKRPEYGKTHFNSSHRFSFTRWIFQENESEYRMPIFANILYWAGILEFTVAIILSVVAIALAIARNEIDFKPIIAVIGLIAAAVIDFGVAQIIHFIGKMCFNSSKALNLLSEIKSKGSFQR